MGAAVPERRIRHRVIRFHARGSDLRWARYHRQQRALAEFRSTSEHSLRPDGEYVDMICSPLADPHTTQAIVDARTGRLRLLHFASDREPEGRYS